MDTENCQRCLPKRVPAMGFIPLPEPSSSGDSRSDEQRIPLCNDHYFEAKENCFYVVPFDRDDDPVDNFLTLVKLKHRAIRGTSKLSFGLKQPPERKTRHRENLPSKNHNFKVHFLEDNTITCGLPAISVMSTTNVEDLTCGNCISLLSRQELERDPDIVGV